MECEICRLPIEGEPEVISPRALDYSLNCCKDCAADLKDTLDIMALPERRHGDRRAF